MKTKLTHRFLAKAFAAGLFAVSMLVAAAAVLELMLCSAYNRYGNASFEPWLAQAALRFLGAEGYLYLYLGLSLAAAAALFVFLMCAAGRREGREEIVLTRFSRFPFDLLIVLCALACTALLWILRYVLDYGNSEVLLLVPAAVIVVCVALMFLMLAMTFAARVKAGTFLRTNITVIVLLFMWRCLKAASRFLYGVYKNIGVLWKAIGAYTAFALLLVLAFFGSYREWGSVPFLLLFFAGLAGVCIVALQWKRLKDGTEALSSGQLEARIGTENLLPELKKHAQALNGIAEGTNSAIEARMKSERMKTDLITNVSHDLKTPLTSIVNYVDLLKKEQIEGEAAQQYLEVLSRQAQRLKKLTEDIVEASRASSGAVSVTLEPTDVGELLHQSVAEYAERFAAAELSPQVRVEDGLPRILADGRLSWRVLDNLFGNAVKYSLPSTRVYCEAAASGNALLIRIKNISREPLDIPLDELTERFARGDASRGSEGSGLGLCIAKSLTELQGGSLNLSVDGDLFKVELCFSLMK